MLGEELSTRKAGFISFLIFNYFSKHPRYNLSKNLKKKIDKKTRYRLWAVLLIFFLGIIFYCCQWHGYLLYI